jgi:hypothetical protein
MKSRQLTREKLGKIKVQRICLCRFLAEFALHLRQPTRHMALAKARQSPVPQIGSRGGRLTPDAASAQRRNKRSSSMIAP